MEPEASDKDRRSRLSPITAAIMATIHKCGWKRLGLATGVLILVIVLLVVFVSSESPEQREDAIRKQLVEGGFTTETILTDENSAQYKALMWISKDDPYRISSKDPNVLQRFAMATVYYSMTTDDLTSTEPPSPWKRQDNWLSGEGICSWYGVDCSESSDDNGPVVALNLTSNDLRGNIPTALTALSHLHKLDLSSNEIKGRIPKELSSMTSLLDLWLRDNALSGTIPSSFGKFSNVRQFHLGENRITGRLPKELEHMVSLRAFAVDNNRLSGHIPNLRDMEKLTVLYLDHNRFSGVLPTDFTALTALRDLRLSVNFITGTLPSEFGNLNKLGKCHEQ